MEAWLQIKVPEAISQDGHEKSGMAKAMITMAVKDVHLALVQRASSAKEAGTVSSEFTCKLGTPDGCSCAEQRTFIKDSGESLQAYFARMYALNDELIACGSSLMTRKSSCCCWRACQGRTMHPPSQRSPSCPHAT
jgi:hypothetical protein